jgi:hypothetical protein
MADYECANCGAVYPKTRPDSECWDELIDNFPPEQIEGEEIVTICDDCYQLLMARIRAEAPELLREDAR